MRIAQVAPLYESVPPKCYGGTERVVSYLTEALIATGHEVTLYASGDSATRARLRAVCQRSLRLDPLSIDSVADHIFLAETVVKESAQYDVIHSHIDYIAYPVYRRMSTPHVTTLHGRLDIPNLNNLYREFHDIPLVSISNSQRLPLSWAHWTGTVYHGLPKDLYSFHGGPGKYLAFIGRTSPEKRLDYALQISRESGIPLKIAAKIDPVDHEYFERVLSPLLKNAPAEFIGEIGETEKADFLGNAQALLFPIDWPEPFGLVMIEAMACGTPVIALLQGSVPEVIDHGTTGFVVRDVEDAVRAVREIPSLDRQRCRQVFEGRFTADIMAQNYLRIYSELMPAAEAIHG